MNCHSCGAAVSSADPTCAHCGARLATVSCPNCFSMMFLDARFCPACGSPSAQWDAGPSERPCPGCGTLLLHGELKGIHLHECPKCFGLWLDKTTFEQICRKAEEQATPLTLGAPQALSAVNLLAPVRYHPCPDCRQLMNRFNFAHCSGVIVDTCRAHGIWFEADELHRIVEFIRAGGMGRSREKEKADLAEERRRLDAARHGFETIPPTTQTSMGSADLLDEVVGAAFELLGHW
jgi:Zn-finger nucleic acid-binding protein